MKVRDITGGGLFPFMTELAPGVVGYTLDLPEGLYVPLVESLAERQGNVGRYIDGLPITRRVVFPNVISPVLAGMLARRGFRVELEWAEDLQEEVECWVRRPREAIS